MGEDAKAMRSRLSASDFVSAVEESGVLSATDSREWPQRLGDWHESDDATTLAR